MKNLITSIGLMSGTSSDGIDASTPSQEVPLIKPMDVIKFFINNYLIYNYYCVKVILIQTIYEK